MVPAKHMQEPFLPLLYILYIHAFHVKEFQPYAARFRFAEITTVVRAKMARA